MSLVVVTGAVGGSVVRAMMVKLVLLWRMGRNKEAGGGEHGWVKAVVDHSDNSARHFLSAFGCFRFQFIMGVKEKLVVFTIQTLSSSSSDERAWSQISIGLRCILDVDLEFELSDVNALNAENNTPLHWAFLNGHIEVVKALILGGATMSALNRTSVDEAINRGKLDVVEAISAAVAQVELEGVRVS